MSGGPRTAAWFWSAGPSRTGARNSRSLILYAEAWLDFIPFLTSTNSKRGAT